MRIRGELNNLIIFPLSEVCRWALHNSLRESVRWISRCANRAPTCENLVPLNQIRNTLFSSGVRSRVVRVISVEVLAETQGLLPLSQSSHRRIYPLPLLDVLPFWRFGYSREGTRGATWPSLPP